jgi:hypothetical protein
LNDAQFSPDDSKFDHGVLSTPTGLSGASAPLNAMPADTLSEKADKPVPRCTTLRIPRIGENMNCIKAYKLKKAPNRQPRSAVCANESTL